MIQFDQRRILCLGDVMLDRFLYGGTERISPEAPVPVVRLTGNRAMLGGAGNVARNIASLGGEAVLVGLLGTDATGQELAALLRDTPGIVDACIRSASRPTTCKTRVIAGHQHVVRLDEEVATPIGPGDAAALAARVAEWLPRCHALILSDYAKGLLGAELVAEAIGAARRLGLPVFVDPKREDFGFYRGATVLKPNMKEMRAAARQPLESEAELVAAARALAQRAGAEAILLTRSEKGMMLVEATGAVHSVPAQAREVFDVSGAGDTVIAVAALSAASGHALPQAMRIANAAAGVVVGKLGTATVSLEELRSAMEAESQGGTQGPDKFATLDQAASTIEGWRRRGLRIGFTNGCFDILHRGHVTALHAARQHCDRLVVALNTDDSVRRLKGPARPINPLEDRAAVIAALEAVDLVIAFAEDTPLEVITRLQPDLLFKGADYTVATVVGADVVQARGGQVVLLDLVPGRSTTRIIERSRGGAG